MLTLLILGIMVTNGETQTAEMTRRAQAIPQPRQAHWLTGTVRPFAPIFLVPRGAPAETRMVGKSLPAPVVECTILVIKPDPLIDPKMAREADKGIDPGIVRPSDCRK